MESGRERGWETTDDCVAFVVAPLMLLPPRLRGREGGSGAAVLVGVLKTTRVRRDVAGREGALPAEYRGERVVEGDCSGPTCEYLQSEVQLGCVTLRRQDVDGACDFGCDVSSALPLSYRDGNTGEQ